jgi:uncharacterized protein YqhQ
MSPDEPPASERAARELQIGGQAVIEGVVMRGPDRWALAVRKPSGAIYVTMSPTTTLAERYPRWNRFPVRGIFALADSLIIGVKSLSISAGIALEEGAEDGESHSLEGSPSDCDGAAGETGGGAKSDKSVGTWEMATALVLALALFLGLFIVLPTAAAGAFDEYLTNTVLYNLAEGFIRVAVFIGYLLVISLLPDVKRLYEYHGAEHKVVHAYEAGLPLTARSAEGYPTAHVRCGTTFILIVLVISVLVFSLFGRPALWLRVLERLAVIPFVAALSYEIIKFAGSHEDSRAVRLIMAPGLWLQRLTTREPDEEQLEVATRALDAAVG